MTKNKEFEKWLKKAQKAEEEGFADGYIAGEEVNTGNTNMMQEAFSAGQQSNKKKIEKELSKVVKGKTSKAWAMALEQAKLSAAKEIFEELDNLCEIEHGMSLESVLLQNGRSKSTQKELNALKKKFLKGDER